MENEIISHEEIKIYSYEKIEKKNHDSELWLGRRCICLLKQTRIRCVRFASKSWSIASEYDSKTAGAIKLHSCRYVRHDRSCLIRRHVQIHEVFVLPQMKDF